MQKLSIITLNEPNITDFARARNKELDGADSEWVLFVDSDEKITREFADKHLRIGIDSLHQLINRGLTVKHLRF